MKTLKQYINEAYEDHNIKDLVVKYKVGDDDNDNVFIVECPNTAQESDVTQYIDDVLLNDFPSGQKHADEFFGDNMKYLNDAYFEYDKFEHIDETEVDTNETIDIKFNERDYGKKLNKDDKLDLFKLTNLKYVLEFDEFNITGEDSIDELIKKIFVNTESNNNNKYIVTLKLLENEITYRT